MPSQRVESTVVISVSYDEPRRRLKVRFRNGKTYYYLDVPPDIHQTLLTAPSIGKYLNTVIKPNYRAVRGRE